MLFIGLSHKPSFLMLKWFFNWPLKKLLHSMHLSDACIQSDWPCLQCIFISMCFLGIEPIDLRVEFQEHKPDTALNIKWLDYFIISNMLLSLKTERATDLAKRRRSTPQRSEVQTSHVLLWRGRWTRRWEDRPDSDGYVWQVKTWFGDDDCVGL